MIPRSDMQDWLRESCSNLKKTILLATHDTDEAIYLSDRILILGTNGGGIRREICVPGKEWSREWLYGQRELRAEIYGIIKERRERK